MRHFSPDGKGALIGANAPDITAGEDENRPVGVIVHHVAGALQFHAETARRLARGEPVEMTTWDLDALAELNARHAALHPKPDRAATLRLLRERVSLLAETVGGMTDEELDRTADVYGARLSAEGSSDGSASATGTGTCRASGRPSAAEKAPLTRGGDVDAPAVARRYIDAWNAHDGATVLGTFAEGGTYADPATGESLSGRRIAEYADGLFALLPDVCFDVTATHGVDDTTVVVPWRMRGTAAAPPGGDHGGRTGPSRTVDLPGLDVIAVDGDRVRSVVGYFDQKTMLEQLGNRLVMVPADTSGPFTFGAMVRGSAGSTAVPGAFSVTALLTRLPEARAEVDRRSHQVYEDLSAMPGFLSFLGLEVGDYMMTVTAWESVEAVGRMMRSPAHAEAVRWLYDNDVADAGMLSVLRPERMTLLRRCGGCCALVQAAGDEPTCPNCGRSLTQRGSYV